MNSKVEPKDAFDAGLSFYEYLVSMETMQAYMQEQFQAITLLKKDITLFSKLAHQHNHVYILALTEDDCPDAVLNLPIAAHVAKAVPNMTLRVVRSSSYPALAETYVNLSSVHDMPILIFMNGFKKIIAVWHTRPAVAHHFLARHDQIHPAPARNKRGKPNPAYEAWVKMRLAAQKVVYRESIWRATLEEFKEKLLG